MKCMRVGIPIACVLALALTGIATAAFSRDGAVITNSGSTNTAGFTIKVWSDGSAAEGPSGRSATSTGPAKRFNVPTDLTRSFFAHVKAARDAGAASEGGCMKSASFGTRLTVQWHGWTSPDLSCPSSDATLQALAADVARLQAMAKPSTALRRGLLPNEPRRTVPSDMTPAPTPTPSPDAE